MTRLRPTGFGGQAHSPAGSDGRGHGPGGFGGRAHGAAGFDGQADGAAGFDGRGHGPARFDGRSDGRARVFGDDVNTDYIISSSRKRKTIEPSELAPFVLEALSAAFAASVQPGDVIVAGRNFGCGSAMEVAVTVIQAAGIRSIVARSFARSFFRNAINNGLLVVECDTSSFQEGDRVSIDISEAAVRVLNVTRDVTVAGVPLPPFIQELIARGGLVRGTGLFSTDLRRSGTGLFSTDPHK